MVEDKKETYLVESDEGLHHILVGALHSILVSLDIQSVESLVLLVPSRSKLGQALSMTSKSTYAEEP